MNLSNSKQNSNEACSLDVKPLFYNSVHFVCKVKSEVLQLKTTLNSTFMELKLCVIFITNQWLAYIVTRALGDNQPGVHGIVHWFWPFQHFSSQMLTQNKSKYHATLYNYFTIF